MMKACIPRVTSIAIYCAYCMYGGVVRAPSYRCEWMGAWFQFWMATSTSWSSLNYTTMGSPAPMGAGGGSVGASLGSNSHFTNCEHVEPPAQLSWPDALPSAACSWQ